MSSTSYRFLALVVLLAAAPARGAQSEPAKPPANPDQSLRAVGLAVAQSLSQFRLTPEELEKVIAGIREGAKNPALLDDASRQTVNEFARYRFTQGNAAYLEKAAKEKGATKTASGAILIPMKAGTGPSPKPEDKVEVHYHGTLVDGTVFDSSVKRGQPAQFPLNGVIKCWTEGVGKMKVGGKAKLVCPPDIAYGERGAPPVIPSNAVLTFEVELLKIVK